MLSIRALFLASGTLAIAASDAPALTFDHQPPLHRMIAEASMAFRGTIESIEYGAARVSADHTIPYENIRMRVGETFGGVSSPEITLRQMGGRLPGEATKYLVIPGLADLMPGEVVYVFGNDRAQPFFATIYGDASLLRVANDEAGRAIVMNAFWQPLVAGNGTLWPQPGVRCLPLEEDRSRCARTETHMHDPSDDEDVQVRAGQPLTPAMLDRFIRRWRGDAAAQGQTVSADAASFEEALAAFGRSATAGSDQD